LNALKRLGLGRDQQHVAGGWGAIRIRCEDLTQEAAMVKLVVAYGPPDDPDAFDRHYAETHAPLAQKIPNLRRFEAGKVLGTADGSAAPYYFIAELLFDSPDELQAAMQSQEGQAAAADVGTFASGGATLMIADA
jgi:uncharacterized protein (TIGR02118 family)